jgi:hypothetical protein
MTNNTQTLKTMQSLFEVKTKDNEEKTIYTCLKTEEKENNKEIYDILLNIIYDTGKGTNFDYTTLLNAVDDILDYLEEDQDNTPETYQEERIYQDIENHVDIYNYDLLTWLSSNLYNMEYVDNILADQQTTTLSQALMQAQSEAMREIYQELLNNLSN